jgi:class 3 adenylate cyclase
MLTGAARLIQSYLPRSRCLALANGVALPEVSQGVCLFADFSGFTPLTESLRMSLGPRQGAEALTGILNQVLEALIGQVHAHGGDVLGFAGDAMTVFFEASRSAPDQAALALRCAVAMQAEMARFSAVPAPDGQLHSLMMKIGLAYGPVQRLLAGQPEYGLFDLLAGESLRRMAAAEHHAEKGEILCAPEYPALLGEQATWGPVREGYLPLVSFQAPLVDLPLQPVISELLLETLRPYFPPDLFVSLAAAPEGFLAELRPVVSAFVRLDGLDYSHDPAAGEKLKAYVALAQRLAAGYHGNLIRLDYSDNGSILHVIFGAPVAYEEDEAHAVGWALDLQSEARQLPFITAQMIGMARGQVYVGALGASTRRGYTLMGDEVNASARLMQACQPWQTLVSQPIMLAAQKRYMFHQFPGFQVKGKYEPVPVAMPVAPLPTMPQMPAAPLVGREAELALLDEAINALLGGSSQLLRIVGGAGVGKSRLTAELLQRAILRGVRTLAGSGQSVGQGALYLPWREIIRSLFGLQAAWPA